MKWNWKKTLLPATLALMVAIPSAVAFADSTNSKISSAVTPQGQGQAHGFHFFGKGRGHFGNHNGRGLQNRAANGANHQEYMLLLAEKYTPDQLSQWNAAYAEQKNIMDQLKPYMDAKQADVQKLRDQMKQQMQDLKKKIDSGEITKAQAMQQMKQSRDANKAVHGAMNSDNKAQMDANKALHDEFNKAIQALVSSGNTDDVKKVLPQMLDQLKQHNQTLTDKLNQLKQS